MAGAYEKLIRCSMARQGMIGAAEPGEIEAWMRLEHGTLDGLSAAQFDAEVAVGVACCRADPEGSRRLAATY